MRSLRRNMSDTFDYYVLELKSTCPICGKAISCSDCFENHGTEVYNYLLKKNTRYHCIECKQQCDSFDIDFHHHNIKDVCFWCKQSWQLLNTKPDDMKHLIPCYREFIKQALPPILLPTTDNDKEEEKCPICNESLNTYPKCTLKCKHNFHTACISNWILDYFIEKCPICFEFIDNYPKNNLKRYAYLIERYTFRSFFNKFLSYYIPNEYKEFYFNAIDEFYESQTSYRFIELDSVIYPEWTLERFKKRFACIGMYNWFPYRCSHDSSQKQDIEKRVKKHFKYNILGNKTILSYKHIDNEMLKVNNSCCICLEEFNIGNEVMILSCKHFFHKHCTEHWFENIDIPKTCPTCRQICNFNI